MLTLGIEDSRRYRAKNYWNLNNNLAICDTSQTLREAVLGFRFPESLNSAMMGWDEGGNGGDHGEPW